MFFQLVDLHHRRAEQGPIDGRQALQSRTSGCRLRMGTVADVGRSLAQLRGQFGVAGLKQPHERAFAERTAHGLNFGELAAAAEHIEKLRALFPRPAKHPELVEDDPPRHDRNHAEDAKHPERKIGPGDEVENRRTRDFGRNSARRLQKQGGERASKRAQTALRDVAGAPLGQRRQGFEPQPELQNCITLENCCQTYVTIGVLSP